MRRLIALRENFEARTKSNSEDLVYIAFSKLKENIENKDEDNELKMEGVLSIAQTLRYAIKRRTRSTFDQLKKHAKFAKLQEEKGEHKEREERGQHEDTMLEKHMISNQV